MAKGRVVWYKEPEAPPAPTRQVYTHRAVRRRRRPHPLRGLLFALSALVLAGTAGFLLWYQSPPGQSTLPRAQAQAQGETTGDGQNAAAAAAPAAEERIVVAIDPGHGGVNPSIGAEDYGSEANGLRESEITLATARALYDLLAADDRFAPLLTADGSAYLKPSERGEVAARAGAQLFLSIHLNYDSSSASDGFECYAAPPNLETNAESVQFGEIVAQGFYRLGMELRGVNGVRYLYYDANDNKRIYESTDTTVRWDPTFTVLSSCGCPAVLCEEGFISNSGDMARLAGADGCRAAAQVYYESICSYFQLT